MSRLESALERIADTFDRIVPLRRLRPLERIPSIKLKLSILILAAIAVTVTTTTVGFWLDVRPRWSLLIAVGVALVLVQILARGLTAPLREMSTAADAIADGDLNQRVAASSADEVGELGRSFNTMAERIAALEAQRRDLFATVSHELRTPVAVIQGNVENLLDGLDEDRDQMLEAMLRQTRRLGGLIDDLMDLSRLEAGAAPMNRRPIDLSTVLESVIDEARLRDPEPKIALDGPVTLPCIGDPARLHQVFANLVDNAIRHQPADESLEIATSATADSVTVRVRDRGPGIPAEQLPFVFDRFHRATGDPGGGHAGLGLAIVRGIVHAHEGDVIAANHPDGGCEMTVVLPTPTT
ncbi:MAG: ATP-binding protein [Actinomycetota bacterium]